MPRRMHTSRRSLLLALLPATLALFGCQEQPTKAAAGVAPSASAAPAKATNSKRDVILATTTSTRDSGLLDALLPAFTKASGYTVKTIAVGSGRAIAMGKDGEADVLLTHAPDAEREIVKLGAVTGRRLVMHNDFVLIGPDTDPASVKGKSAVEALSAIHQSGSLFLSRGDDSGTHKLELKLWKAAALEPSGKWYQESGSGMGQTLTIANQKNAYTLSDRATYLAHQRNFSLTVLVEGGSELMNPYHVMLVNADRFAKVNRTGAAALANFLLVPSTQTMIASFGREKYGRPLFYADGGKTEEQLLRAK
jgi:tungstate transport system substrate-binding protein